MPPAVKSVLTKNSVVSEKITEIETQNQLKGHCLHSEAITEGLEKECSL